ncbi:MAG: 3-phosphoserine/phosphohydroxythreonine transaminase [Azoarcus sp.]|jgi:phosphoserine aminotransferase|nr:3-phosphoserine/phosphohydroxythreonine transaminase [Azoarcus sp.]
MTRAWNFSAGPATLPLAVLQQAQKEFTDWHGIGASIVEVSHRGPAFSGVIADAEADLRELLAIPENYRVLFLQGGASLQFAQVPMNLANGKSSNHIVTGTWSQKAYKEAARLGAASLAASTEEGGQFKKLPAIERLQFDSNAAYVHLCTNETIHGIEVHEAYEARLHAALAAAAPGVPLVADMSSHILSRPLDVSRYGLIYAGAQKNVGPSGVTLVIVRNDLLDGTKNNVPTQLLYRNQADNGSMLNTPATFSIYMAGLVFKWLKGQGGLKAMAAANQEKARRLYEALDHSKGFYRACIEDANCRSIMNVPFNLPTPELEAQFVKESESAGFIGLKGHKSVGGIRASLYNAVPLEAVDALLRFMEKFAAAHRPEK